MMSLMMNLLKFLWRFTFNSKPADIVSVAQYILVVEKETGASFYSQP